MCICAAPPLFLDGFNATIKNLSDTLRLACVFAADPLPTVEWYFQSEHQAQPVPVDIGNGTDVFLRLNEGGSGSGSGSESGSGSGSGGNDTYEEADLLAECCSITSTVVIAQVTVKNEGTYICSATNGVPNLIGSVTSHNSTVKVQGN